MYKTTRTRVCYLYINKIYEQMFLLSMLQFFNIDRFDFGSDIRKWNKKIKIKNNRLQLCFYEFRVRLIFRVKNSLHATS